MWTTDDVGDADNDGAASTRRSMMMMMMIVRVHRATGLVIHVRS